MYEYSIWRTGRDDSTAHRGPYGYPVPAHGEGADFVEETSRPWTYEDCEQWVKECYEMGFREGMFEIRRRTVGDWVKV